jgi:lipoprotein-anchoring transpeptidase ErfK/SrfK
MLAAGAVEAQANQPLRLQVSLSEKTLEVLQGDDVVKSYEVAVGKPDHPTPKGRFNIRRVIWNPRWVPPDAKWARGKTPKGPEDPDNPIKMVKLFFRDPDYYIHGTGEIESIGKAASHGCIRMTPEEVTELARMVMEHGGVPKPDPWYRRLFRSRKTLSLRLAEPVALAVVE